MQMDAEPAPSCVDQPYDAQARRRVVVNVLADALAINSGSKPLTSGRGVVTGTAERISSFSSAVP